MDNEVNFNKQTVIFKEGAAAEGLFLIKEGTVLCLKSSKDRLIPVFLAKEGDIVGESAIVNELEYTYSTIAYTDVKLIKIPATSLQEAFDKAPDWLIELTTTMIARFQNTSTLIAENRLIHPSILSEEEFSSELEVKFKNLLS